MLPHLPPPTHDPGPYPDLNYLPYGEFASYDANDPVDEENSELPQYNNLLIPEIPNADPPLPDTPIDISDGDED